MIFSVCGIDGHAIRSRNCSLYHNNPPNQRSIAIVAENEDLQDSEDEDENIDNGIKSDEEDGDIDHNAVSDDDEKEIQVEIEDYH